VHEALLAEISQVQSAIGQMRGHSPENKRVSRLFSVTTDSAPLSPARKLSSRSYHILFSMYQCANKTVSLGGSPPGFASRCVRTVPKPYPLNHWG
jgi:hypothetical protein